MGDELLFNYEKALHYVSSNEINTMRHKVAKAHEQLHTRTGKGSDFLGWLDLPVNIEQMDLDRIKEAAKAIQSTSEVFIVIGIGGSYLGAKAVIDLLTHTFYNAMVSKKRHTPEIYFVGQSLSPTYMKHLIDIIDGKDLSINVISKSGNTLEPAVAFRFFRQYMEKKYGAEEASKRIYVTTDKQHGALKNLSDEKGYQRFIIPDDIGGRYSVLTPVGLLPIAVSGIDIDSLLLGAAHARERYLEGELDKNESYQYAVLRHLLFQKGKYIELLVGSEPHLRYFAEWWKQLFGESEGKEGRGIFPAYVEFTTDLHSLGQFIQDGNPILFETVIHIDKPAHNMYLGVQNDSGDGLNYLEGKSFDYMNKQASNGTIQAHHEGGVPILQITMPELNAYYVGMLLYFFEKSCAISGYLFDVNPFDQPGVEAYKSKMYALLGRT